MGCWCQNRDLALGGADEACCEMAGIKAEVWRCAWVALVKLVSISFCLLVLTFQVALGGCGFGRSPCWNASPFFFRPRETESLSK